MLFNIYICLMCMNVLDTYVCMYVCMSGAYRRGVRNE